MAPLSSDGVFSYSSERKACFQQQKKLYRFVRLLTINARKLTISGTINFTSTKPNTDYFSKKCHICSHSFWCMSLVFYHEIASFHCFTQHKRDVEYCHRCSKMCFAFSITILNVATLSISKTFKFVPAAHASIKNKTLIKLFYIYISSVIFKTWDVFLFSCGKVSYKSSI